MKPCPVAVRDTLIRDDVLVCNEDWIRLLVWARNDLDRLAQTEPGSDLRRHATTVALAYLDDLALAARAS